LAEGIRYACRNCARSIEAWSDGNPFYIDDDGRKRYAYHPDHENLARCIGNDSPHLCLACGSRQKIDSRKPRRHCRRCRSGEIVPTWELEGKPCPYCKDGNFDRDPSFLAIS
jgi:hypothetical protein